MDQWKWHLKQLLQDMHYFKGSIQCNCAAKVTAGKLCIPVIWLCTSHTLHLAHDLLWVLYPKLTLYFHWCGTILMRKVELFQCSHDYQEEAHEFYGEINLFHWACCEGVMMCSLSSDHDVWEIQTWSLGKTEHNIVIYREHTLHICCSFTLEFKAAYLWFPGCRSASYCSCIMRLSDCAMKLQIKEKC